MEEEQREKENSGKGERERETAGRKLPLHLQRGGCAENFAQETNTFRSKEILFRFPALWVNRKRELTKSCQCQQEYLI